MQTSHDFLDAGFPVPPMEVEEIDVVGSKLLQRCVDGDVHRLHVVSGEMDLLGNVFVRPFEIGCILCPVCLVDHELSHTANKF